VSGQIELIAEAVRIARHKVFGSAGDVFSNPEALLVRRPVGADPKDHWLFHKLLNRLEVNAAATGKSHVSGTLGAIGQFSEEAWLHAKNSDKGLPKWLGNFAHKGPLRSPEVIRKTRNAWQNALKGVTLRAEFELPIHGKATPVRVEFAFGHRWAKEEFWISARVERQEGAGGWLAFSSTTEATRFDADVQIVGAGTPFAVVQKVSEAVAEARRSNDVVAERELTDVAARLWNIKLGVGIAAALLVAATSAGVAWYLIHHSSDEPARETPAPSTTAGTSVDVRSDRRPRMVADTTTLASGWGLGHADCQNDTLENVLRVHAPPSQWPVHVFRNNQLIHTFKTAEEAETGYSDRPGSNRVATYKLGYANQDGFVTNMGVTAPARPCIPGNRPPVITTATATPRSGTPTTYELAVAATDPDGDPLTYEWAIRAAGTSGLGHRVRTQEPVLVRELYEGNLEIFVMASDNRGPRTYHWLPPLAVPSGKKFSEASLDAARLRANGDVQPSNGEPGQLFTFRVADRATPLGAKPASYRWFFECPPAGDGTPRDCYGPVITRPVARHRFSKQGYFTVHVEVTYTNGDVEIVPIATLNVCPACACCETRPAAAQ
jgi:hypothetical protein